MKPLPRVLAYLDDSIATLGDFGVRASAVAAAGSGVALVARSTATCGRALFDLSTRLVSLARPPMAQVLVSGRADVALGMGADGVIGTGTSLTIADLRSVVTQAGGRCAVLASVHDVTEAAAAVESGADALVVGTIWRSASHPERQGAGLDLIRETATLGVPIYAIGGVTVARVPEVMKAGAWGVAAIGAIWRDRSPWAAANVMLDACLNHFQERGN